jgi:hypothetical protein
MPPTRKPKRQKVIIKYHIISKNDKNQKTKKKATPPTVKGEEKHAMNALYYFHSDSPQSLNTPKCKIKAQCPTKMTNQNTFRFSEKNKKERG